MDVDDIKEQIAFDLTQNEEWCKQQQRKAELEHSRAMTNEEKSLALKAAIKGLGNGGNK